MKSVICRNAQLHVADRPPLKPARGQVLLEVLRCGICGSDLHMRQHCDHMRELTRRVGYERIASSSDELVFGHEFCGEILDYGAGTKRKLKIGTRVCAVPLIRNGEHIDLAKGGRLTPIWPKPSIYLARQLVAIFYPDGTSIASEFDLDNPDQGEFHGERFHISITPMQGEIVHVPR